MYHEQQLTKSRDLNTAYNLQTQLLVLSPKIDQESSMKGKNNKLIDCRL